MDLSLITGLKFYLSNKPNVVLNENDILEKLPELKILDLFAVNSNDDDVYQKILKGILKEFHLSLSDDINIKGDVYREIFVKLPQNIEYLNLSYANIPNKGLKRILKDCQNLIELNLTGTKITNDVFKRRY